ncbi:hypothetical protein DCC81_23865 [Chitinophaga parva]|uniref:Uncharacterized protein n=1 Tax=Chitinophaga parva TaxID=2169414 RepID=A0A2T7BE89_9BACT|nr:hypothetical protein [Chitinophaga parva]PUZ23418.1 hypothetical protein DCC81_23865 [Chitinophaga parva]
MPNEHTVKRRAFVGWIGLFATSIAGLSLFRKSRSTASSMPPVPVTLLTEDGRLVQVDAAALEQQPRKKISNDELRTWVKKRP